MALAIAAAAVIFAVSRVASHSAPGTPTAQAATLPPSPASYLGVYAPGSPGAYQPVADFAKAAGRQPNLVGYFSGWAEPFATAFAQRSRSHGAATIVQIDPTDADIAAIAAGAYDKDYLRPFADSVRNFGHPVVIGFGHEMNAPWYPWGYGHVPPRTFVAAWRHIVTLFRGQGADNVTWLWTINADLSDTGPITSWWPGARYVSWVGIDGYYYRPSDNFAGVFGRTIDSGADVHPQAGSAVRDRRRTPSGPATPRSPTCSPGCTGQDARAGVVRHGTARRDLPPGLAHPGQPGRRVGFPAGRARRADAGRFSLALTIRAASGFGGGGGGLANSVNVLLAGVVTSTFSYAVSRCAPDRHVM